MNTSCDDDVFLTLVWWKALLHFAILIEVA
jgi:hypothetical protein